MNERIGTLLNRSGGELYEGFLGSPNTIRFTEEEFETFAELIIKECAGVCEEYRGTEWGKAAECIGDSIKEHFGVE